jgi:hypothetical protein
MFRLCSVVIGPMGAAPTCGMERLPSESCKALGNGLHS